MDDANGLIEDKMELIENVYIVLSGKGGVGKSTVAANLAAGLAMRGRRTGLLDIDIHGPTIPGMFGLSHEKLESDGELLEPAEYKNLKIMSVGFLLESRDDAVIWRGPMKYNIIKQFLGQVNWGELDCLVIDSPPGTGDEPLSTVQLIPSEKSSAVIVTTPQNVAIADVRRSVTFCSKLQLPVAGVIENMSGFVCPECKTETHIFSEGGGEKMAKSMNIPFLGSIPIDPEVMRSGDAGGPFIETSKESVAAQRFADIIDRLIN